ncbi:hypothetical protein DFH09DRAFT_1089103 [Mycena vulgaris]|nr:hypothetical protein DFH09DRAFT_1089103 [Mycena vulgaris]
MPPTAIDTALTGTITKCLPDGLKGIHGVRGLRLDSPAGTRIYVASATGKPSGGPWEIRPEQEAERDPIAVIHAGVTSRKHPAKREWMRHVITLSDDTRKPRVTYGGSSQMHGSETLCAHINHDQDTVHHFNPATSADAGFIACVFATLGLSDNFARHM